jgi:hypothetical protein
VVARAVAVLAVTALGVAACGDGKTPATAASGSSSPAGSTTPFSGTTLAEGEVVQVADLDGARLHPVEDGIVRSFETSVEVTEIGWADRLGAGDEGYRAADGDAGLVVFSMTTERTERATPLDGEVVAAVSVDDRQRELPGFSSDGSPDGSPDGAGGEQVSYAVAVPEDRRSVVLELKYGGVVQSFDLLDGKPTGERPDALYRSAGGTAVFQEALTPAQLEVDVAGSTYKYTTTVRRAELGYFPVQGTEVPSSAGKGWLTMWIGTDGDVSTCVAPLSAYRFTDAAGTVYQPAQATSKIPEPGIIDSPESIVTFEVPADLAKGTLTVSAPRITCQTSTATFNPVPARGTATVDVTLPER